MGIIVCLFFLLYVDQLKNRGKRPVGVGFRANFGNYVVVDQFGIFFAISLYLYCLAE